MLCAECAYRCLSRSYVIRGDLLQVDHVMYVVSDTSSKTFQHG